MLGSFLTHTAWVVGRIDEKTRVLICPLKDIEELEFSWNWVKKLKTFNNSLNKGVEPWEGTCNCLDTCLLGYNLKQLRRMCPETPQWWQTWVVFELLDFLEWGLTKDLELAKSVLDFIPFLPFSY